MNYKHLPSAPAVVIVLIDTWWNVNRMGWIIPENVKPVLIDTWWNVNQF